MDNGVQYDMISKEGGDNMKKVISVAMDKDLLEQVKRNATETGRTLTGLVVSLLKEHVKRENKDGV